MERDTTRSRTAERERLEEIKARARAAAEAALDEVIG